MHKQFFCTGEPQHGDRIIRGMYSSDSDPDLIASEAENDRVLRRCDPVAWIQDKIREARRVGTEISTLAPVVASESEADELPPIPAGWVGVAPGKLLSLRGMVTIYGAASSGKSYFVLGTALEAAAVGWDVHYIAAEGADVTHRRVLAARGRHPDGFTLHAIEPGITPDLLIDLMAESVRQPRTLFVFDSVSTLLALMRMGNRSRDQFDTSDELEMFLLRVRALTRGDVSFLVISESNAAGSVKGRTLAFRSDMAISFASEDETGDYKRVTVVKSWESSRGDVGLCRVDPEGPGLAIITPHSPYAGEPEVRQW